MIYRRLIFTVVAILVIVLSVVFLGIPTMVKFSLFLTNLKGGHQAIIEADTVSPFPPRLETAYTATNSATIAVKGVAEAGSTVHLFVNDELFKKILVASGGDFSLPEVLLVEGENVITARAEDAAGNQSSLSDSLVITYRKRPPLLEISQPQDGERFSGENKEAKIIGLTESGATVTINGRRVLVKSDGSFAFNLPLNPEENLIKIVANDSAGNQTTVEKKVIFSP